MTIAELSSDLFILGVNFIAELSKHCPREGAIAALSHANETFDLSDLVDLLKTNSSDRKNLSEISLAHEILRQAHLESRLSEALEDQAFSFPLYRCLIESEFSLSDQIQLSSAIEFKQLMSKIFESHQNWASSLEGTGIDRALIKELTDLAWKGFQTRVLEKTRQFLPTAQ